LAVCFNSWREKSTGERCVTKVYIDVEIKDVDRDERTEKSIITTECVDRDEEIVLSKGLDFEEFKQNPVVLFMHDPTKVVGRCQWVKADKGKVVAKTQYAKTELGDEVWELVRSGMLRGKSIGMDGMTVKRRDITPQDVRKNNAWAGAKTVIEGATIHEYSVVSIPANPEALTEAWDKGLIKLTKAYFPAPRKSQIVVPKGVVKAVPVVRLVKVVRPVKVLSVEDAAAEARRRVLIAKGAI